MKDGKNKNWPYILRLRLRSYFFQYILGYCESHLTERKKNLMIHRRATQAANTPLDIHLTALSLEEMEMPPK